MDKLNSRFCFECFITDILSQAIEKSGVRCIDDKLIYIGDIELGEAFYSNRVSDDRLVIYLKEFKGNENCRALNVCGDIVCTPEVDIVNKRGILRLSSNEFEEIMKNVEIENRLGEIEDEMIRLTSMITNQFITLKHLNEIFKDMSFGERQRISKSIKLKITEDKKEIKKLILERKELECKNI